jgi:hypothetical protein
LTAPEEPVAAPEPEVVVAEHPEATVDAAGPASAGQESSEAAPAPPPEPHFSTVTFKTTAAGRDAVSPPPAEPSSAPDTPSDLRSLFGNIFTRRKAVEEPEDEGPSIADRIARDFGLLGGEPEEPEAETSAVNGAAPVAEGNRATVSIASHPEAAHPTEAEHG